jgi:hypothetical protein
MVTIGGAGSRVPQVRCAGGGRRRGGDRWRGRGRIKLGGAAAEGGAVTNGCDGKRRVDKDPQGGDREGKAWILEEEEAARRRWPELELREEITGSVPCYERRNWQLSSIAMGQRPNIQV